MTITRNCQSDKPATSCCVGYCTNLTEIWQLSTLSDELVQSIFEYLTPSDLRRVNLVSHWARRYAVAILWRSVDLVDCETPLPPELVQDGAEPDFDDHDDTPLIKKLFLLARCVFLFGDFVCSVLAHECGMVSTNP